MKTGKDEGSGTKAPVFLTLFGDEGDSGPIAIGDPAKDFKQKKNVEIKVKFYPCKVGKIYKARLNVDSYTPGEGWFCEKVRPLKYSRHAVTVLFSLV